MEGVKQWYDGYVAANNISLYNPWSINSFINKGTLEPHWVNTACTRTIQKLIWYSTIPFKETVERLLNKEDIEVRLNDDLCYDDLTNHVDDALLSLLYYAGYLSLSLTTIGTLEQMTVPKTMRIPNQEVMKEWYGWLRLPGVPPLDSMLAVLLSGNLQEFHDLLSAAVMKDLSYNDVERFVLQRRWWIKSLS